MTTYRLGINTCFAVKRWPQPERWAALVRDELGLDLVQHGLDLVDLDAPPGEVAGQAEQVRAACAAAGLTLHSTFTGLAAYSSNLLLHPDPAARERARASRQYRADRTRSASAWPSSCSNAGMTSRTSATSVAPEASSAASTRSAEMIPVALVSGVNGQ